MSNKKLRITINNNNRNNSYDVLGEYDNEIYNYIEPDTNTKVLFDVEKEILSRGNDELDMNYDFSNEIGSIYVKDLERNIDVTIKVLNKEINNNKVSINYMIDEDTFNYIIEVKE